VRPTLDDPEHDPEQARARERDARQVEPLRRAVALLETAHHDGDQDEADRDVDPEDPLPRDALDDGAADDGAERDAEAAHAAPDAERQPALLGRERLAQKRQRQRRDDRAAEPLERARRDQRARRGRERRRGRAEGEDQDADREHPAPAEAIAECGGGGEEDGERQRVGVDGPLELVDGRPEVHADARQGGGHDEVVERDHEQGHAGDDQCPYGVACHLGRSP
jgi:hypothetical protein